MEPVPIFRAFMEYSAARNHLTDSIELIPAVVAPDVTKTYTINAPLVTGDTPLHLCTAEVLLCLPMLHQTSWYANMTLHGTSLAAPVHCDLDVNVAGCLVVLQPDPLSCTCAAGAQWGASGMDVPNHAGTMQVSWWGFKVMLCDGHQLSDVM